MAGRWVYNTAITTICTGDALRERHRYEGEDFSASTSHGDEWADNLGPIKTCWNVEEVTRNGWLTLRRMTKKGGMWDYTDEVKKVRSSRKKMLFLVSLTPQDGWRSELAPSA